MYHNYFGLSGAPFSIVPDHRVVYMSDSHRKAVAHLLYSLKQPGGFVQLTGEVGTGKTTVSRYLLQHLPENVDVALLLNPRINEREMLEAICEELGIDYSPGATLKGLISELNEYLLASHAAGRHTVLIIDEAQNLSRKVLEQVRLLTNLETSTDKLLQIILIGQPELIKILGRHDLRQLSQRIVGRFKLEPLNLRETREYISYRLKLAGCERRLFDKMATRLIHKLSGGVPRVINVLCDTSLMAAYSRDRDRVSRGIVSAAAREILPDREPNWWAWLSRLVALPLILGGVLVIVVSVGGATGLTDRIAKLWQPKLIEAEESPPAVSVVKEVAGVVRQSGTGIETRPVQEGPLEQLKRLETGQEQAKMVATSESPDTDPGSADQSVSPKKEQLVASKSAETATESPSSRSKKQSEFDLIYRLGVPLNTN